MTETDRIAENKGKTGQIDLARFAPIRMGALTVEPALRRVVHDQGREEFLEPRVMQVLVALIRADGAFVTRDDLLASCWRGMVVGEDAITRVIGRLRRIAEGVGMGDFKVETVNKVGYHLLSTGAARDDAPSAATVTRATPSKADLQEPLLAVLAFDDLCDGGGMRWFTDGVSEEILQTVARAAGLRVIGRGSSFQFRGADKAAARVAKALRATHVLDGSVRRSGSTVRIAAHLIECAGETTLWSERFDGQLSDVFALQDKIAGAVAAALKIAFAPATRAEAIAPAAYDLYLSTRSPSLGDATSRAEKIKTLEEAVALAPGFARAWLQLASLRVNQLRFDGSAEPYGVARAKVVGAATNALTLDPRLGEAHQTLSRLEPFAAYEARTLLEQKALAVAPNDLRVLYWAFALSCELGRLRDAMSFATHAFELDPLDPTAADSLAYILENLGRYQESRAISENLLTRWPESLIIVYGALAHASQNADWDWFDEVLQIARERNMYTQRVRSLVWLARNLRNPNQESIKRGWDQALVSFTKTGIVSFDTLTSFYRLGYTQEVFDLIDEASFDFMFDATERWPSEQTSTLLFNTTHNFGMMRDPRFPRLCAKLGLCDYWVKTDCWPDCADAGLLPYDFKAEVRRLAAG